LICGAFVKNVSKLVLLTIICRSFFSLYPVSQNIISSTSPSYHTNFNDEKDIVNDNLKHEIVRIVAEIEAILL
jgi:hypothetical protein